MRPHKETHPDNGKIIECPASPELSEALRMLYPNKCNHNEHEIRTSQTSNGGQQIRDYCLRCGHSLSSPMSKNNFSEPPEILDVQQLRKIIDRKCTLERIIIVEDFKRRSLTENLASYSQKQAYLKSKEWQNKRKKVFERADYLCEGCREKPAEEVHHLTYKNLFDEFLFELVALCPTCHSRIHFEEHPNIRTSNFRNEENILCEGCRHQSETDEHKWCGYFDLPSLSALKSKNKCDDGRQGYEGLR